MDSERRTLIEDATAWAVILTGLALSWMVGAVRAAYWRFRDRNS